MRKIITLLSLSFVMSQASASTPSLPCFVEGVMVRSNISASECQSELKGSPHKKQSYSVQAEKAE